MPRIMGPDNPLDNPYLNNEIPRTQQMGGDTYVAVQMHGETKYGRVRIAHPALCGHCNRICQVCARTWEQDYEVLYSRTSGGRKLKQLVYAIEADLTERRTVSIDSIFTNPGRYPH